MQKNKFFVLILMMTFSSILGGSAEASKTSKMHTMQAVSQHCEKLNEKMNDTPFTTEESEKVESLIKKGVKDAEAKSIIQEARKLWLKNYKSHIKSQVEQEKDVDYKKITEKCLKDAISLVPDITSQMRTKAQSDSKNDIHALYNIVSAEMKKKAEEDQEKSSQTSSTEDDEISFETILKEADEHHKNPTHSRSQNRNSNAEKELNFDDIIKEANEHHKNPTHSRSQNRKRNTETELNFDDILKEARSSKKENGRESRSSRANELDNIIEFALLPEGADKKAFMTAASPCIEVLKLVEKKNKVSPMELINLCVKHHPKTAVQVIKDITIVAPELLKSTKEETELKQREYLKNLSDFEKIKIGNAYKDRVASLDGKKLAEKYLKMLTEKLFSDDTINGCIKNQPSADQEPLRKELESNLSDCLEKTTDNGHHTNQLDLKAGKTCVADVREKFLGTKICQEGFLTKMNGMGKRLVENLKFW